MAAEAVETSSDLKNKIVSFEIYLNEKKRSNIPNGGCRICSADVVVVFGNNKGGGGINDIVGAIPELNIANGGGGGISGGGELGDSIWIGEGTFISTENKCATL